MRDKFEKNICSVNYSNTGMSITLIRLLGLDVNNGPLIRLVNSPLLTS